MFYIKPLNWCFDFDKEHSDAPRRLPEPHKSGTALCLFSIAESFTARLLVGMCNEGLLQGILKVHERLHGSHPLNGCNSDNNGEGRTGICFQLWYKTLAKGYNRFGDHPLGEQAVLCWLDITNALRIQGSGLLCAGNSSALLCRYQKIQENLKLYPQWLSSLSS